MCRTRNCGDNSNNKNNNINNNRATLSEQPLSTDRDCCCSIFVYHVLCTRKLQPTVFPTHVHSLLTRHVAFTRTATLNHYAQSPAPSLRADWHVTADNIQYRQYPGTTPWPEYPAQRRGKRHEQKWPCPGIGTRDPCVSGSIHHAATVMPTADTSSTLITVAAEHGSKPIPSGFNVCYIHYLTSEHKTHFMLQTYGWHQYL